MKRITGGIDPFMAFRAARALPDPSTFKGAEIQIPAFNVDREPFFRKGKAATLNHYRPTMLTFKRGQDQHGNWVWTLPLKVRPQNWRMN